MKDAQQRSTSRNPSHQTTLLGEMPPLKFSTAPQHAGPLGDQFESVLAELLQLDSDDLEGGATVESSGSGRSQQPASVFSRNQEATPTGQEATPTGQEALLSPLHLPGRRLPQLVRDRPGGALSETRTGPLPGLGRKGEGEALGGWLTGIEGARTAGRMAGTLPTLPAASQYSSGKPTSSSRHGNLQEEEEGRESLVPGTGPGDSSSAAPLRGEGPPQPRLQAILEQQVEETTPLPPSSRNQASVQRPAATFPTEVPEYSADLSSEKEHSVPLLAAAEDKSLR